MQRRKTHTRATVLILLLHGYIAWRLLSGLDLGPVGTEFAIGLLMASCVIVPVPLWLRVDHLSPRQADALNWIGYLVMGLYSMLLMFCVLRDGLLIAVALTTHDHSASGTLGHVSRQSARAVLPLSLLLCVIGFINSRRTARVVEVDLPIARLPDALDGFTIVQLSDLHVGPTIQRRYLEAIVRRVNRLQADVVVITGDLVDGSVKQLRGHLEPLSDIRSRYGTFCVTGNHEYYHDAPAWIEEWRRLGLQVLIDDNRVIHHQGADLLLGGVTDYSAARHVPSHRSDAQAAARVDHAVALKILLAHQPRTSAAAAAAGFDVQLSGHTHGGQFPPWTLFVPLQQPFIAGLHRVEGLLVYISRGTGYWGPPLRFWAPSEITRLQLVRALAPDPTRGVSGSADAASAPRPIGPRSGRTMPGGGAVILKKGGSANCNTMRGQWWLPVSAHRPVRAHPDEIQIRSAVGGLPDVHRPDRLHAWQSRRPLADRPPALCPRPAPE